MRCTGGGWLSYVEGARCITSSAAPSNSALRRTTCRRPAEKALPPYRAAAPRSARNLAHPVRPPCHDHVHARGRAGPLHRPGDRRGARRPHLGRQCAREGHQDLVHAGPVSAGIGAVRLGVALPRSLGARRGRARLHRDERLAGVLEVRLVRLERPPLPFPRQRRAHLRLRLLPGLARLLRDPGVRLQEERPLLGGGLGPGFGARQGFHPRIVLREPLLLRGGRAGPPGPELAVERRMRDEERDLLLRRRLRPGVVESLARKIRVLEREQLPLLRSGVLPGLLDLLDHPRSGLEECGTFLGSRGDPPVLQRACAEERVRAEDLLALVRRRLVPALLDDPAALPEGFEEMSLLVG